MNIYLKLIAFMAVLPSTPLSAGDIFELLPPVPEGWELQRDDRIYDPESLYDYIDGGAELYLSYGMKEVVSRIIAQGENEIRVEIFDMAEARNAFGVFTNTRLADEKQYGQGSQYFTGAQIFWKDRYYVAITANDENDAIVEAIQFQASSIDSRIGGTGEIPAIVQCLPGEGLQPDGYLYFYHYIWLNAQYYIANDNFLNIDSSAAAVLGKYNDTKNRMYLLLVHYPERERAEESYTAFRERFLHDSTDSFVRVEDMTWLGCELREKMLVCVFNAKTEQEARELLSKVTNHP